MVTIEELRTLFLFEAFSDEQLAWLQGTAEEVVLAAGSQVLVEGEPTDYLWVLLEGQVQIFRGVGGQEVVIETTTRPSTWAGWLPMFDGASPISMRTPIESRMLRIGKEGVRHMLAAGFPVATHLLNGIVVGVQSFEAIARQQEKLAALGKLSAGLAHELNNPAAAAERAASRLREALRDRDARGLALGHRLDEAQAAALTTLAREASARPHAVLDPLARSDREDALGVWLDDHGVPEGWDLVGTLVEAGVEEGDLDRLAEIVPAAALSASVGWLCASLEGEALATAVARAAERISELVQAIKDYTYMDRAPVQDVDVHKGLDDTLAVMRPALKADGVEVERRYAPDLPRITAFGSALNQVWTNLIDNAIDAVAEMPPDQRRITITTGREGDGVAVEIADTGPGIPPEVRDRIFDPFFTTKPLGKGTGLGLDTTYRVVVREHGGDLRVDSRPGETRVRVRLPIEPPTLGAAGIGEGGGGRRRASLTRGSSPPRGRGVSVAGHSSASSAWRS